MTVLRINDHDWTPWTEGMKFSRDDLDSNATTRLKNGSMRRVKVTEKRNLTFTMRSMPAATAAQLDTDLHANTFSVTYLEPYGERTSTFYCSQFQAELMQVTNPSNIMWTGISFNLHEI